MHEYAVTCELLDLVLAHARRAGAARVTAVHLVIGDLASIIDDSVGFYWDLISQDTPADGAQLVFKRIPARLACQHCGRTFLFSQGSYACPACKGVRVSIISGDEFYLECIDIDTKMPEPAISDFGPSSFPENL